MVLGYDAVYKKATVAAEKDDVTFANGATVDTLNHQRVSGPHRGEHAPSRDPQTQFARRAQNFARQVAFQRVHRIECRIHERLYETLLCWQLIDVGLILPHESAEVTNTCS
jgi:hypothetical protein